MSLIIRSSYVSPVLVIRLDKQYFTLPHLSYWTPIGLLGVRVDPSGVRVESNQTQFTLLNFTLRFIFQVESEWSPSGVRVESEWTNLLNAVEAICKSLLCCDISPIGLHSDWIGTYNLVLKLVSENVKAWFWQALNPHPQH
jgi:hypothetical protein